MITNPNIMISDAACAYIKKMIEQDKGLGFRLSIKKTGCSGYSYSPSVVEKINPTDVIIDRGDLKIYIDSKWLELLKDLQLDYIEENKSGLKQKRLVFVNPKESSRCGC